MDSIIDSRFVSPSSGPLIRFDIRYGRHSNYVQFSFVRESSRTYIARNAVTLCHLRNHLLDPFQVTHPNPCPRTRSDMVILFFADWQVKSVCNPQQCCFLIFIGTITARGEPGSFSANLLHTENRKRRPLKTIFVLYSHSYWRGFHGKGLLSLCRFISLAISCSYLYVFLPL